MIPMLKKFSILICNEYTLNLYLLEMETQLKNFKT